MVSIPEGLHNYSLTGLSAMADLMAQILDGCASRFDLPVEFLEAMEDLRGEINSGIEDNLAALEEKELSWLPGAPELKIGEDHANH